MNDEFWYKEVKPPELSEEEVKKFKPRTKKPRKIEGNITARYNGVRGVIAEGAIVNPLPDNLKM